MSNPESKKFQLKNPLKNLLKLSKKKKILLAVAAVVVIAGIAVVVSFTSKRNDMRENMEAAFTTETALIERQTLTNSISATGTVESAETKTVNTKMTNMEVVAVNVKEGDYVEEGTIICEFDSSDYEEELAKAKTNKSINDQLDALEGDAATAYNEAVYEADKGLAEIREERDEAKDEYQAAEDELEDEENDLASAKKAYESIADKHTAAKNAVTTYQADYTKAQNDLAEKNAKLDVLEADLARIEKELESNPNDSTLTSNKEQAKKDLDDFKSKTDFNELESKVNEAKADLDAASKEYNTYQALYEKYQEEQSEYNAAKQDYDQKETAYEQAQERREDYQETYDDAIEKAQDTYNKASLEEQKITESQEEKTIDEYTELIEDCVVKADMSGVITSLNVTVGNNFEGGDIYTIQDNENFIVSASVDEYDIASIEKGMSAYIKTDATGDVEMTGEVTYVAIAPTSTGGQMGAISSSASYRIEVTIANPDEHLRAGMTAKLSIALEESKDTLTVPYDAVTTDANGNSTITIDDNGERKTITVATGLETDYYTEIISDDISEGMTVYLTTPMITANPNGDDESGFPGGGMMPGGGGGGFSGGGGMPSGGGGMPGGGPGGF